MTILPSIVKKAENPVMRRGVDDRYNHIYSEVAEVP
jgi:hypothetical protein